MDYLSDPTIITSKWEITYPLADNEVERNALNRLLSDLVLKTVDSINSHYVRHILKIYFEKPYLKELSKSKRKPLLHVLFTAVAIRDRLLKQPHIFATPENEILNDFPIYKYKDDANIFDLNLLDEAEKKYLYRYCVVVKEMLKVIPGKQNQGLFLAVGALIEGSGMIYKTGGEPSKGTLRRLEMFRKLGGVKPIPKIKKAPGFCSRSTDSCDSDGDDDNNDDDTAQTKPKKRKRASKKAALKSNSQDNDNDSSASSCGCYSSSSIDDYDDYYDDDVLSVTSSASSTTSSSSNASFITCHSHASIPITRPIPNNMPYSLLLPPSSRTNMMLNVVARQELLKDSDDEEEEEGEEKEGEVGQWGDILCSLQTDDFETFKQHSQYHSQLSSRACTPIPIPVSIISPPIVPPIVPVIPSILSNHNSILQHNEEEEEVFEEILDYFSASDDI